MLPHNKQRLTDAAGVLATSVTLGLLRAGRLGSAPFSLQVTGTIIGISAALPIRRNGVIQRIPHWMFTSIIVVWGVLCAGPTGFAVLVDLFSGHRRPGAKWYDALWRIYAIIGLWIGFAVMNERYIRPWWREKSDKWFAGVRNNSIQAKGRARAMEKRTAALEGIKARVALALRRKARATKALAKLEKDMVEADKDVLKAQGMLEKAQGRLDKCKDEAKEDGKQVVETMQDMVESAKLHEKTTKSEVERLKLELEDLEDQLQGMQQEWTTALHIESHTEFVR